jgi:hypothetical protein
MLVYQRVMGGNGKRIHKGKNNGKKTEKTLVFTNELPN